MENRKIYIDKMSEKLKEWDDKIAKLESKAETSKQEFKSEYNKNVIDLRLKYTEAKQKLDHLKDAGGDSLEELKTGLEKSWKILEDSIKNAWNKIK